MKRLALLALAAGPACNDALDQRLAIVGEPRVLAITSEPAEVLPGKSVAYAALVASPDGPITAAPSWALCTAPKPPTEDNAVSVPCVAGEQVIDLGTGETAAGTVPGDACVDFGPDVPGGGFRPRDPDPTGGFYQPVRAATDGVALAIGFTRITCKLATAPGDVAHDYQLHYAANTNPTLDPPVLADVAAGSTVTLEGSWPADAAESYLYYDADTQRLITRREAMRLSYFATAGALAVDATLVREDDLATSAATTWRAPDAPGLVWIWLVLRDSRGGIATRTAAVTVR